VKQRHIIQISAYYPPHLGGQENAVRDLALALTGVGHDVHVLTSAEGARSGTSIENNIQVNRMSGPVFGHAPIMPRFPWALFRTARADSTVHLHIGQAFTPEMVWLISKLRRFRYIAELHIDFEPSGPAGALLPLYKALVLKRVLRSASSIITLNEKTLSTVRDVYGYTGRAQVMSNGIDEVYFTLERSPLASKPPEVLRLLFVGRLSKQKNLIALLGALKIITRPVRLDVVGEGAQLGLIERTIADYGLTNVILHGRLKRDEVIAFYRNSDALIMPSLYEAQPLVLLEAMAARIPIIGTDVIGVGEHIRDVGIIVPPTAEGLVAGIEQYYEHYAKLQSMVERGYGTAKKLRWSRILGEYEGLYEAVARG